MKIRASDRRLASSTAHQDPALAAPDRPTRLLQRLRGVVRAMHLRIVEKRSGFGRWSRLNTAFYREIRVGTGWRSKTDRDRAAILAHELVHARQWRHYGRAGFAWRYITSQRFRWAMEVQAYAETVRAQGCMGLRGSSLANVVTHGTQRVSSGYAITARGRQGSARAILEKVAAGYGS